MSTEEPLPADARRAAIVGGQVTSNLTPAEQRLADLGAALRAPGTDSELDGLAAAQAALAGAIPLRSRRARTAVVVGAGVAGMLLLSGVAAAATGSLPGPVQHWVHSALGLPDRGSSQSASPSGSDGTGSDSASGTSSVGRPSGSSHALPTPSAGQHGMSNVALCQVWVSRTADVNVDSAIARSLTALAGSQGISSYCDALLATARPSQPPAHPTNSGKPSTHPTQAKGPNPSPDVAPSRTSHPSSVAPKSHGQPTPSPSG